MKKAAIKAWYSGNSIHITASGIPWRLEREKNLEELWEEMDSVDNPDDKIPYWTELWPSSLALANFLMERKAEIGGKLCADLGCGLGFTAILGQSLGAQVLGIDYIFQALKQAGKNALFNLAPKPALVCMDWREPAILPGKIPLIWGADIMYEQRFAHPLLSIMDYALDAGGKIWLAEPGRTIFQIFIRMAREKGWRARCIAQMETATLYAQSRPVPVSIWELCRNL